ncbi:MAG: hypothetical protein HN337_04130 [Deltaproteobacteria bacterium]|jgi:hypothetical protein|nr:hypothetical protein [Deltaproteobacteria bacterium]
MGVDPIVCVKYSIYKDYPFLKDATNVGEKCEPPEDGTRCSFLATRGRKKDGRYGDGIMELHCGMPYRFPAAILTEKGELFVDLSKAEFKQFYETYGKAGFSMKPTKKVDASNAQSFFIKMFGGEEFTPAVREKVCKKPDSCPVPNHD